jgi:EmrB/QacA subfamily drug resistance transporter
MDRNQIVLFILVLGTMMGALDSTIVILAFPTIADSLHANLFDSIWIILVYMLVVAVMTTTLGRLGDIYGRSKMFNAGFLIFTAGSAFCGLSPHIYSLILFRGLQAMGGSLMQANSGAIIADVFPPNARGRAFGYLSMGFTGGAMLGIVLGGAIASFIGWEYIFFINIPIGIIALVMGLRYLKDFARVPSKIDVIGAILLGGGLLALSFGAIDFATEFLLSLDIPVMLAGAALLITFIIYERRAKSPMLDFTVFTNRILRYSILAAFFQSLGYLAVVFLITMYLQGVRGLDPFDAALLLTPGYVVGAFLGPLMGRLSDKYGARLIATTGIAVIAGAIFVYLTLRETTPLYLVLVASGISGTGTSMFFPANNSAVMANAQARSYGSVSGLLRTVQNIGILGSFVLAISVAAASIPRQVAFEIFIGTTTLVGSISQEFIVGIDSALYVSLLLLAIAGILSLSRGREVRSGVSQPLPNVPVNVKDNSEGQDNIIKA